LVWKEKTFVEHLYLYESNINQFSKVGVNNLESSIVESNNISCIIWKQQIEK
jgi:hypothetical protein